MDDYIARHLEGVSRTYAIVVPMLPAPLAHAVGLAYLVMRVVDTLEDAPDLAPDRRLELLTHLQAALADPTAPLPAELSQPIGETAAERDLMAELPQALDRLARLDDEYRAAITRCACEMMAGVREFQQRATERNRAYPAVRDADELRRYCYFVAGVVGEMLCGMMAHYLRLPQLSQLRDVAVELGIGLQLVNVLKDCLKDASQGRRYLPMLENGDDPRRAGVAHAEIYRAVLQEARASLSRGVEFVLALPAHTAALRSFCGLPIAWGAMTLARAERNAAAAKIGRSAIQESIQRFRALAGDDGALRGWLHRLLAPTPA